MPRKPGNVALEVAPTPTVLGYVSDFKAPQVAIRIIVPSLTLAPNVNQRATVNLNVSKRPIDIQVFVRFIHKNTCLSGAAVPGRTPNLVNIYLI